MSNSANLRPEAGGDPARSNSTDLKNQPKAPQDDNDFPDAPAQKSDDTPQDKPDLDAFAKRIGTDTIETGEGLSAVPEQRTADQSGADTARPRLIIAGGGVAVAGVLWLVTRRRAPRSALSKVASVGAVSRILND